jgi:acyl-CoA thioesterase YciA
MNDNGDEHTDFAPNVPELQAPAYLPPSDQTLVLKVIPMPADCNANGDIFGGWVMAQVDLAGAVLPARYMCAGAWPPWR